jgi:hypothetical protein
MNDLLMIMLASSTGLISYHIQFMTRTKVNMAALLHSCSSFLKCSIVFSGSPALRYGESLLIHDKDAQFYEPW